MPSPNIFILVDVSMRLTTLRTRPGWRKKMGRSVHARSGPFIHIFFVRFFESDQSPEPTTILSRVFLLQREQMTRETFLGLDFIVTFLDSSSLHTGDGGGCVSQFVGCSAGVFFNIEDCCHLGFTSIPLRRENGLRRLLFIFLARIYGGQKRFCKLLDRRGIVEAVDSLLRLTWLELLDLFFFFLFSYFDNYSNNF